MKSIQIRYALIASVGCVALLGASLPLMSAWGQRNAQTQPEPKTKITPIQAIKIAQGKVPGRPIQANFEIDEGHWVYGVMIVKGKTIKEVEIDPITGKIGGVETVTPNDEAKEVKDMLTKAIGGKAGAKREEREKEERDEKP
jgi:hypothetical protein